MAPKFDYDLSLQLNDGTEVLVNPEEHGLFEPERLAKVKVWTLIPRTHGAWPVVSVQIPPNSKPIFKSRVYGKGLPSTGGPSFRAYAIGWYDASSYSHWIWVLPGGVIEVGEDPESANVILRSLTQ